VLLEGVEIAGWAAHRIARAGVAYVPEGRQIFPDLNVVENIRVAERRKARIWPLDRLFEQFPALRERAGNKGAQLSGGEQQMLAIARALAKVLLLDEPSQGLAPLVVRELAQVIRLLRSDGVAILLIEQNVKLAEEVADEINVMVKGRIVYCKGQDGHWRERQAESEILQRVGPEHVEACFLRRLYLRAPHSLPGYKRYLTCDDTTSRLLLTTTSCR
jgi:branched-chain amino acid transport system ATP-binding protein